MVVEIPKGTTDGEENLGNFGRPRKLIIAQEDHQNNEAILIDWWRCEVCLRWLLVGRTG